MSTLVFALSSDPLLLGTLLKNGYDVRYFETKQHLIEQPGLTPNIILLDDARLSIADIESISRDFSSVERIVVRTGYAENKGQQRLCFVDANSGIDEVIACIKKPLTLDTPIHLPKTVLIIEDNHNINEMYTIAFRGEGCTVVSAYDGLDGITKAAQIKPDIIILDIMMPNMDGFEMLKVLKSNTSLSTKVIVNTNLEGVDEENKARALGADGFLRKSKYTPLDVVKKILSGEII